MEQTTTQVTKVKPETVAFIGFGQRNPSVSIVKWPNENGGNLQMSVSYPMIKNAKGWPERITFSKDAMTKIYDKLSELKGQGVF